MYENILVPISLDGDRDVNLAVKVAKALSSDNSSISLLHVIEHVPKYSDDLLPNDHFGDAKTAIANKLQPMLEDSKGLPIEVVEGHSGRTILDYSASHKIDCIVIASHRPGLSDYFLGSTAARVVRHATCAVHVVR